MKILIVSGFLGAGKTTFIKMLAQKTRREIAILENEYGSLGVDADTLRGDPESGNINIWELTEGCICCSMKGDFAESVLTIANTVDPEYLVIEPTGVGMLSSIIRNLQQIEYERIMLLAPVTIADGHSYQRYVREYADLYKDQLQAAHRIIVSKMEQADAGARQALQQALQKWNPRAQILTEHYSVMPQEWWMELLETKYDGTSLKVTAVTEELPDTLALENVKLNAPEQLILLLEQLIRGAFGDIIRAKGCVRAGDAVLKFDVADGLYAVTGGETEAPGKAVFIGKDIRRQELRRILYGGADRVKIRQNSSVPGNKRKKALPYRTKEGWQTPTW
ncbi:MAG: GTP-binding protein [Lachnospiraceae bacterium]|nr:GTP-binding protein [Lachnospiraceae bacterium]